MKRLSCSRRYLFTGLSLWLAAWGSPQVLAQTDWPSARPIAWVVPYPPGASSDIMGRLVAQKMAGPLGQPVVVDNRTGGGGSIGIDLVRRAAQAGDDGGEVAEVADVDIDEGFLRASASYTELIPR